MICSLTTLSHWLMVTSISLTTAYPTHQNHIDERAPSFYLRILPLGGSITAGWGSSTGNGLV